MPGCSVFTRCRPLLNTKAARELGITWPVGAGSVTFGCGDTQRCHGRHNCGVVFDVRGNSPVSERHSNALVADTDHRLRNG